jgi:TolB-like protein
MELFRRLRERRVAQFFLVYCASGWFILQVLDQVTNRGLLPELPYRLGLTLFLSLLPGALIVSWFHGEKGHQTVPLIEKWMLAGVGLFALLTSGVVVQNELSADDAEGRVAAALAPWEDPARVAVLYFDARAGGEEAEDLAAGLTEDLIAALGGVQGLNVVSRNGSELFRGANVPLDSIGKSLEVGTLVSGQVALSGDRVRVDVHMAESRSGRQVASERLERPRADLFDLQDELVQQVATSKPGSCTSTPSRPRGTPTTCSMPATSKPHPSCFPRPTRSSLGWKRWSRIGSPRSRGEGGSPTSSPGCAARIASSRRNGSTRGWVTLSGRSLGFPATPMRSSFAALSATGATY